MSAPWEVSPPGGSAGPPGPSGTDNAIIFRPGVASSGPAVATWAEVQTAIAASDGAITVLVDSTHVVAHVPAASGVTDFLGAGLVASYNNAVGAAPTFSLDVLIIDDGAQLKNLRGGYGYLGLFCDSKTVPSLVWTLTNAATRWQDVALMTTLTATIPACELTGAAGSLSFYGQNTILGQAGGTGVFHISGTGSLNLQAYDYTGLPTTIDPGFVTGTVGTLQYSHDSSTGPIAFTFSGTYSEKRSDAIYATLPLTTAGFASRGLAAYVSAAGVASPTDSGLASGTGTLLKSTGVGIYDGILNQIVPSGPVTDMQFTTAGGAPAVGAWVYLAAASDDGATGAGKLTATVPTSANNGWLTRMGVCLDASAYAGSKTAKIAVMPQPPIAL